jgi:hypothetical protein
MAILINDGMPREPLVTKTRPPAITVHHMIGTDIVSTALRKSGLPFKQSAPSTGLQALLPGPTILPGEADFEQPF